MRRLRTYTGFTAIEVLLAFTMLALLFMLLLPGLQASRQAARRAQCLNNLRQIGTALQNYETVMNVLPPGCVNTSGPIVNEAIGYHMGWTVQSLPMIDQRNLFEMVNWTFGVYATNNTMVGSAAITTLQCASDPELPSGWRSSGRYSAASSYAGCIGGTSRTIDVENTGLLYLNSSISDHQIPDGRSQTILVGEVRISSTLLESGLGWASGTAATLRSSGLKLNSTDENMYEVITEEAGGFGSWHDGMASLLFADGSAKSFSEETDVALLVQLGDRADGQMMRRSNNATDRRIQNRQRLQVIRFPEKSP